MKLKTSPAPVASTLLAAASVDAPTRPIESNARVSLPSSTRSPSPDPFAALIRKFAAASQHTDLPAPTAVNGTVIGETQIDGIRYVVLRCAPRPNEALLLLSPRERDIVNLITKGYPNKMIAELLDISAWTVGTHLRRIFAKLGVTSRAAMVARYLHHVGE